MSVKAKKKFQTKLKRCSFLFIRIPVSVNHVSTREHALTDSLTNSIFVNVKLGTRENSAKKVTNQTSKIAVHIEFEPKNKKWCTVRNKLNDFFVCESNFFF